ncbi:hypothetical protein [Asticcacaulis sp. AC460]|uniref:hypothetical protein n=1 Tax=Asticcacaulis sp. AC460 TaxID=1282360 RepID=UPI0012DECB9D|nr:hypothetical protein [Asticcacaulis sp. AC460]
MPTTDTPPCHGDSSHDKPVKTVMACCAHHASLDLPTPMVWSQPVKMDLRLSSAPESLPVGLTPAAEPRPPKHV